MNTLWTFLVLVFINYMCDYPFQGFFLAEWKSKDNFALIIHCVIWSMGIAIGLEYFEIFSWWKLIMLFVGHFLMDGWKCRGYYKKMNFSDKVSYYIDQIFHLIQVGVCLL